jgi:ABC-type branched-subunit amino acid transport system permease subunit
MTPQHCLSGLLAVGSCYSLGSAAAAWAHHPMPRPATSSGPPWSLMWFLGAGVFVVAFVASLAVFSILERRQRAGSDRRQSERRS